MPRTRELLSAFQSHIGIGGRDSPAKNKVPQLAALLPGIFTLDIGGKPILTFEAKNLREAWEVCHEAWLKDDFERLHSNARPLWDGKAHLRARYASQSEIALHRQAVAGARPKSDE